MTHWNATLFTFTYIPRILVLEYYLRAGSSFVAEGSMGRKNYTQTVFKRFSNSCFFTLLNSDRLVYFSVIGSFWQPRIFPNLRRI